MIPLSFLFLLSFWCAVASASAPDVSISAVTLLLPPALVTSTATYAVSVALHAYGGCFHFTVTDDSLLTLTPEPSPACARGHTSVILTPTEATASLLRPSRSSSSSSSPSSSSRRAVRVTAEPLSASSVSAPADLYCDVFLDRVHHVELLTATRRVYVGGEDTRRVQGYDAASNVFSSLEGLPFHWSTTDSAVLELRGLKAAGVNASARLLELEEQGVLSSVILVQGKAPGKATVTAVLQGPKGSEKVGNEVELVVVERLVLEPYSARVCPGSAFALSATSTAPVRAITLPSPLYHFTQSSPAVLSLSRSTGRIVALSLGSSDVSMQDNNVEEHRETAHIDVVHAHDLTGRLVQHGTTEEDVRRGGEELGRPESDGWWIKEGSAYRVVIRLRDAQGQAMHIAPNVHVRVSVEGGTVSARSSSVSSLRAPSTSPFTLLDIAAKRVGPSTLVLSLDDVSDAAANVSYAPRPPIVKRIPITVTAPVIVAPPRVLLPATPSPSPYAVTLQGGSGEYTLRSPDPAVLSTSLASILAHSPGRVVLEAEDARDPDNRGAAEVEVAAVGRLSLRDGPREALKGQPLELIVDVADVQGRAFDECAGLSLHMEQAGEAFQGVEAAEDAVCDNHCDGAASAGCWRVALKAVKAGRSGMTVSVRGVPSSSTPFLLSAFGPATFAESDYLAGVGSAVTLALKDGPISLPHETAVLSVAAYLFKGGREAWKATEQLVERVYRSGQEGIALPSALTPAKTIAVESRPLPAKGGMRESSVTCEEGSVGDFLVMADVSHKAFPALPAPMHSRAFTWLQCVPAMALLPLNVTLGLGEREQIQAVVTSTSTPHPLLSSLQFTSSNPAVARVSPTGVIEATALGRTLIRAHIPRPYADAARDTLRGQVSVEVKFESFVVLLGSKAVLEGRGVLAHVEGKNGEVPGDAVFEGVSVEWTSTSDGVAVLPPLSFGGAGAGPPSSSSSARVFGYSAVLVGRKAGNHTVQAQVTVGASAVFAQSSTVNYSVRVQVVTALALCGPSALLLPFSGFARLPSLSHAGPSVAYRVIAASNASSTSPAAVSLSRDATTVVARAPLSSDDAGDDAVLMASSRAGSELQVSSLTVSVRPVKQLTVAGEPLRRSLCVGETHEVDIAAADGLARWFDGEDGIRTQLDVRVSNTALLKTQLGKAGKEASKLGVLKLTALPHRAVGYTSVVVRVSLKDSAVLPVYLQLFVSPLPTAACPKSPVAAQLSFYYPLSLSYSSFPLKTQKRRDLVARLHADLVHALDVAPSTVRIIRLDPATGQVDALLTPQEGHSRWHPHQWFLGAEGQTGSSSHVLELAHTLQAQLHDERSAWRRRGSTGLQVDVKKGVTVIAVPLDVDEPPNTDAEHSSSVWVDELEVEQWERTHEPPSESPSAPSPTASFPAHNASESDPYEAIALRIHESFQASAAYSPLRSLAAYVGTTAALVVGGAWMVYCWLFWGKQGLSVPSFPLWLRETAERLLRGTPPLVVPTTAQQAGRILRQQARSMVG